MDRSIQLVLFNLDEHHYALQLATVKRVVCLIEITPLPKAPEIILGVINLEGEIIPVVDIRKRFRMPDREAGLSDQLIIARTQRRSLALMVDAVKGVIECPEEEVVKAEKVLPGIEYVEGVAKLSGDIILIHDLDRFLSLEDEKALDEVI